MIWRCLTASRAFVKERVRQERGRSASVIRRYTRGRPRFESSLALSMDPHWMGPKRNSRSVSYSGDLRNGHATLEGARGSRECSGSFVDLWAYEQSPSVASCFDE